MRPDGYLLSRRIQNGVPSRHLGAATSAVQFSRSIGGTIGVSVMGAILAAGQPAGASPQGLAVLLIPELPLRRTVREVPA